MAIFTVTTKGQVTFQREVLEHLGIGPGDRIELNLLPDGGAALKAAKRTGTIKDFFGLLAGKTSKVATLEEIHEAIEQGWAGRL